MLKFADGIVHSEKGDDKLKARVLSQLSTPLKDVQSGMTRLFDQPDGLGVDAKERVASSLHLLLDMYGYLLDPARKPAMKPEETYELASTLIGIIQSFSTNC